MTVYVDCDCRCRVLRAEYDKEFGLMISIYHSSSKYPLVHKLRQIFHIIKYGHPYEDEITLSKETSQKFIEDIKKELQA